MISIIWEKFYTEDKYARMTIQSPIYAEEGIDSLIDYLDADDLLTDSDKVIGGITPIYFFTFNIDRLQENNYGVFLTTIKDKIVKKIVSTLVEMGLPEDEQIAVVDCDEVSNGYLH